MDEDKIVFLTPFQKLPPPKIFWEFPMLFTKKYPYADVHHHPTDFLSHQQWDI